VPLLVNFTTQDGTAHAGTDYTAESGTLTFAATQNTATIDVPVLNNNTFNGQRTFAVLLSSPIVGAAFQPQQSFAVGNSPVSVAVGDFNGDGKPDLVIANFGKNTVSVLLNTTAQGATVPSFASLVSFTVGSKPRSVAVGDFNGDGLPDLAVANYLDGTVGVLLNTTPQAATVPSFASQITFALGSGPISVAVGDFNGDFNPGFQPDLAVANKIDGTVSVLLQTPETITLTRAEAIGTVVGNFVPTSFPTSTLLFVTPRPHPAPP
jgi:hypothetical protein